MRQHKRIKTVAAISPSVVCVMPPGGQGGGSGVLISSDGYAISNYHVTSGSGNFMKCGLNDGKVYDAVIVGIDPTGDVALIKLLGRDDFPACTPGDSDLVQPGDEVVALGNPFLLASDFSPTVTFGIVSGTHRYQYPANTFLEYTDCIQIDASINPGNSGGPLFDIDGRWIGINGRASFEKRGRINSGAAYAISVRQVQLFMEGLKSGRIVDHGRTEFTVSTYDDVVEVQEISELSEAWRRGLRPGDEVVSFGNRALTSANDFKNILGIYPEGHRVPLVFRNDDGVHEVSIRLLPLHDYESAPKLPEERRPEKDPDQEPEGHPEIQQQKKYTPPDKYVHLYEEKKGFMNYYFNRIETERLRNALTERTQSSTGSGQATWQINVSTTIDGQKYSGNLTVSGNAAGLDLEGINPELQRLADLNTDNESSELYGLLFGMLQWHQMHGNPTGSFTEAIYQGREPLDPSGSLVRVLLTRKDSTVCRWYFQDGSPLPAGVDVQIGAGTDEGRLRFDRWNIDGALPYPGRIGVVHPDTNTVRWLDVKSISLTRPANRTAVVTPAADQVSS